MKKKYRVDGTEMLLRQLWIIHGLICCQVATTAGEVCLGCKVVWAL